MANGGQGDWRLCFRWCEYHYDNSESEKGYRFIWRRPDGSLQAARGQARIPSFKDLSKLTFLAAIELDTIPFPFYLLNLYRTVPPSFIPFVPKTPASTSIASRFFNGI